LASFLHSLFAIESSKLSGGFSNATELRYEIIAPEEKK